MSKPRLIAFYLPQFYPTPENDEWWEPGFTEWTNVARAKPLFKNHYQPKIPRDLGFYDLRVPETREKQAMLAREAGIEGFCYWHYWFGNGKRLLSEVFKEVVETGKPDYPFCLCWANHSWYQKTWDPTKPDKLLIEQTYPGEDDYIAHFNEMLPAFKDKRYMKTSDGRLIFGTFSTLDKDVFSKFSETWNALAKQHGLEGFYFFDFTFNENSSEKSKEIGYDTCVYDGVRFGLIHSTAWQRINKKYLKKPIITEYDDYISYCKNYYKKHSEMTPCINPCFDHSPRSGYKGVILNNSTPQKWKTLIKSIASLNNNDERIVFVKAWNEWGEGNYLEPDSKWGKEYIMETAEALKELR